MTSAPTERRSGLGATPEVWSRALVTGASSGIGEALAVELARRGVEVVLAARSEERLRRVRTIIVGSGGRAEIAPMDVGDTEATVATIRALDAKRELDLVIANAGAGPPVDVAPYSWEALRDPCHVNFCGAVATLTAALPEMVARGRGHLVGIGSLSSFGALPGSGAYCSPKAGLAMLLDCVRLDVASLGVTVTNVHLGFVDTPMVAHREAAMPQLMRPDALAPILVDRLERRPTRIALPQPLAAATRAFAAIPSRLRDRLLSRF